ncbi:hypothetical protein HDF26_001288 [Pedobacter cryoconitis]|uniref:Uncharacterized protein n=1 Tax=Pedobacter cryoconitis TaxID=188932 RepID=A0A7W9E2P6_9SPHI|nr:hypothetical protein [Pedobacter cryoconitis]MBB6270861.1 hypothetical protein [Pedobacter cryoconitis]
MADFFKKYGVKIISVLLIILILGDAWLLLTKGFSSPVLSGLIGCSLTLFGLNYFKSKS